MMLGRKTSLRSEPILSDYGPDETLNESTDIEWVNEKWVRRLLRFCALLSLVSVSVNTPKTFEMWPALQPITFIIDAFVTFMFTAEMIAKIHIRGILQGENAYLRDHWCQFDSSVVFFLWVSFILQIFELSGLARYHTYLSVLRFPRPLIMVRFMRVFLKFSMPKSRVNQILLRSSQQIYNVTLFFLFFMCLYALLGVQFFGRMNNHCVRNGSDPRHVSLNDLAIPDTYCSLASDSGYQCPAGMVCLTLDPKHYGPFVVGFNGFDEFATSIFTVYEAGSQEGWVYAMYRAVDSLPGWRGLFYFTTLIFFLAWLVKNVFIAVIMETFNEIRVQFQQMWGTRGQISEESTAYVLAGSEASWKVVAADERGSRGLAPGCLQWLIQSAGYHLVVMAAILTNAYLSSSVQFKHDGRTAKQLYQRIYPIEVGFTLFFDIEVLVKIWCMGWHVYWQRSIHKFEMILAVGSSLHLIEPLYNSAFTYFQVLRIVRLIKASPLLEDFVFKIFGPCKKLGSLIIFTMCLLIITSSVSMQLFCSMDFNKFETFPNAFMSMFQILTQEGWVDVMDETMWRTTRAAVPLVAIYFILYHLIVTLIVLSLFVAVILDNLELDEDIKKLRQLRAREQSAGIQETLPLRLRIFEKFPDRPQMTHLHKVPADFTLQKVRDSFMRNFVDDTDFDDDSPGMKNSVQLRLAYRRQRVSSSLLNATCAPRVSDCKHKQMTVTSLIKDCNNHRLLLGDSGQLPTPGKGGQQTKSRFENAKSMRRSVRAGSLKVKQTYDHLKENGVDTAAAAGLVGSLNARNPHDFDIKLLQAKRQQAEMKRNQREEDLRENHPYFDTPLFVIGRESRFRRLCQLIVGARYDWRLKDPLTGQERKLRYKTLRNLVGLVTYVDWMGILVTTLSCVSMMFESPFYRIQDHWQLQLSEYVFVAVMSVELCLKVLADGLFFTPKALIRDVGGLFDLFVYVVSLVFLLCMPRVVRPASGEQLLLVLRCLRPLRIVYLVPHMRTVVRELCRGFKEILLVSVLLILLLYVFASYGVQLFGGRLARCNDPAIELRRQCVGVFEREIYVTKMKMEPRANETYPKILVPRVWANPRRFNFDNIGNAMLALFEVLSFKGWLDIRDVIVQRLGAAHSIYIHVFVFIGCMIGLTLFVGVVIANYSENKGTALLTVDQRRWCDLKKRLKIAQPLHLPPRPEGSRWRALVYDCTQNIMFKRFIALLVVANSSLICVQWDWAAPYTPHLAAVSSVLNVLFFVEALLKMTAFSARGYWQSRRNRYDLTVTLAALVWVALNFLFPMTVVRNNYTNSLGFVCIILRFFTITSKHATLRMLMLTVVVSVYKSFFIIMGMFLLLLSYAFAGTILFGAVKYGEGIGRQANFRTAPNSIVVLFRIVTGEDWNQIMHDCMVQPPSCAPPAPRGAGGGAYWTSDCGNFTMALVFFCSFYVIITYIVLNLLVAIIMENFSLFYSNEEDALLSYADIRNFQSTWNIVDKNQRGMIPVGKVKFILRLLKGRLEVDPQKDRLLFKHMCHELERLHNGDDVTFHDVLNMLSYRSVDIRKSLQLEELLAREELEYIIEEEVAKQTIRHWLDACLKRIRAREQNSCLIAGLRATNEQSLLKFNEERREREKEQQQPHHRQEEAGGSAPVVPCSVVFTNSSATLTQQQQRQRRRGVCVVTRPDTAMSASPAAVARHYLSPAQSDSSVTVCDSADATHADTTRAGSTRRRANAPGGNLSLPEVNEMAESSGVDPQQQQCDQTQRQPSEQWHHEPPPSPLAFSLQQQQETAAASSTLEAGGAAGSGGSSRVSPASPAVADDSAGLTDVAGWWAECCM